MPIKNKFGVEEVSNSEKLATEVYIYKQENSDFKSMINDANKFIKENCCVDGKIIYVLDVKQLEELYKILNRNLKNPIETIKEVKK